MNNIEDDNALEIEMTDLDPIEKDDVFASLRIATHNFLAKIPWQRVRLPVQVATLLLLLLLLIPLIIGVSRYSWSPKSITAHECIRQQVKVVYVAEEIITSAGTTIREVAVPVPANSKWLYDIKCG